MTNDLAAVKAWLATINLDLLDRVPEGNRAELILERRRGQLICNHCGKWGHCAYIMDSLLGVPIEPHWLELCAPCDHWLRRGLDAAAREEAW